MRVATILMAGAVTLLPTLVLAGGMCGGQKHETTASSCAEGQVWDTEAQACIDQATS